MRVIVGSETLKGRALVPVLIYVGLLVAVVSSLGSPLIGESIHLYDGRRGGVVCELCRPLRREAPAATEIVRHSERGHAVRLTARAA